MSKTEQELREWCEGVEADNDTLRREIARLIKERDEIKQLVKDSMSLAERCALKCEELKEERNEIRRSFCQMVCDYEADAHGNMDTSKEQVATNNGWDCFYNDLVDANANNQDFRTTDMG
jgi:hypothetical protein